MTRQRKSTKKQDKSTYPLSLFGFNQVMFYLTIDLTVIYLLLDRFESLQTSKTFLYLANTAGWLGIVGGLIICGGYFVAILDHNVKIVEKRIHIIRDKDPNQKPNNNEKKQ